ncbi:hypothetical protein FOA52_014493 [Chlamydomonas sp. UWO 241]|nr:hypothetical protein FOA52_014493 [Chlamydomonas sp. UWO 241]
MASSAHQAAVKSAQDTTEVNHAKTTHASRAAQPTADAAQLSMDADEQKMVGQWALDVFSNVYRKQPTGETVAKLSGYANRDSYYLSRGDLMPTMFATLEVKGFNSYVAGFQDMADNWPLHEAAGMLSEMVVRNKAMTALACTAEVDLMGENMLTMYNTLFKQLFFQDIALLFRERPDYILFKKVPFFQQHKAAWERWCGMVDAWTRHLDYHYELNVDHALFGGMDQRLRTFQATQKQLLDSLIVEGDINWLFDQPQPVPVAQPAAVALSM